ncbi:hypothetical protein G3T14_15665 [Methylobacterium sp. BTF04]|uniref:hypothetical protein n=1 Tax=Methylobacterium sp. BTF04 TaxID=2708300 RepID=UPI0013CF8041|nr:hypothetical protein [Methylobacterium sp. BTF04]NEU13557.1 hypothetical protein [Methylobacterium sp. BTF04]
MSLTPIVHLRDAFTINVIRFRDGTEISIDDIKTAEQGRQILAGVDASILAIEDQIDHADLSTEHGREWKKRAERALKVKRRSRPNLQARIGELARAERGTAGRLAHEAALREADGKRRSFVHAAYQMLGHETCTEIWARAAELQPAAFPDGSQGGRP